MAEGLTPDEVERLPAGLPRDGLLRLQREAVRYPGLRFAPRPLSRSTIHAALATGASPTAHGVVGDRWLDRISGKVVESTGEADGRATPHRLRLATAGDWLRRRHPSARVIAVAGDQIPAVLHAGRRGLAIWDDASPSGPAAARPLGLPRPRWLTPPAEPGASAGEPRQAGERVLELALSALRHERLGEDDQPDLLLVSLPPSPAPRGSVTPGEAEGSARETALRRLDRLVARLLAELDRHAGRDGHALLFVGTPQPTVPLHRAPSPAGPAGPAGLIEDGDGCYSLPELTELRLLPGEHEQGSASPGAIPGDVAGEAPFWALGPGLVPGPVPSAGEATQVAPTLVAWLGLDPLPRAEQPPLGGAIPPPPAPPPALRLTLLHTNDHHGQDMDHPGPRGKGRVGGLGMRAALVDELRQKAAQRPDRRVLLLDAGDVTTGACAATRLGARSSLEGMERMGYEAMALGNHEFDRNLESVLAVLDRLAMPVLSANARCRRDGRLLVSPVHRLQLAGHAVAIFGLTTTETPETSTLGDDPRLRFDETEEVARRRVAELRPQVELLIALSHQGLERDRQLARSVPGIDVIVGGHTHDPLPEPAWEHGTLIVQAGYNGLYLGQAELEVAAGRPVKLLSYRLLPVPAAPEQQAAVLPPAAAPPDRQEFRLLQPVAEVEQPVAYQWGTMAEQCAAPVGEVLAGFERSPLSGPGTGSTLGHLIADAVRWRAKADIGLQNEGGIRDDLPAGPVTLGAVQAVLPFSNTIVRIEMTGEELLQLLQELAQRPPADMGFLHASGLDWAIAAGAPRDVRVGGRPLDLRTVYRVAVNSFIARGGDNHRLLARLGQQTDTGFDATQTLADYIAAVGPLAPDRTARVVRLGP